MFVVTFLFILLPRSATTTCSHSCQILLDASLYCSRGRPTARGWDMAPPDTAEKMEAKAGEGSKENQDPLPHLPDLSSEPLAVVTTPSAAAWTTQRWRGCRAWPWPGASVTSSVTSASLSSVTIRQSVYVQSVTLDTFYSVVGNSKYCEYFVDTYL